MVNHHKVGISPSHKRAQHLVVNNHMVGISQTLDSTALDGESLYGGD